MALGPVDTTRSPYARWKTIPLESFTLGEGFWAHKQDVNHRVSLHHGFEQLEKFGNFNNLLLAAGKGEGSYRTPVFMDSDVYKWLEAVAYQLAQGPDSSLSEKADYAIRLIQEAQAPDGYLNSYWQVVEPERRWADLQHGHELYCAGHLFQAAVAYHRATGDDRLLNVSRRFADYIDSVFGPGKRAGTPGHPEIEMALVELYRETGERRYLDLACYFVDQRGRGLLGGHRLGSPAYYQDHVPVREATTVEGHAVRQLYLTAGVTDIYLETGEQALFDALLRQWHDMVSRKLFITGGVGSQHAGEAFGEPYELPNERCYCETCAQIASIMWNWRMLLATGEARYADLMERTLYNGFLSGVSLDGRRYFYVNPLLSHGQEPWMGRKHIVRPEWHGCACCPPNVMRMLSAIGHYFASADESGVQIHQYAAGTLNLPTLRLRLETEYPWQGAVHLTVEEAAGHEQSLSLRIPGWCTAPSLQVNGADAPASRADGYWTVTRVWQAGDQLHLSLPMAPTLVAGHPRVDATRGSVAIQRGPLVYCLEQADHDPAVDLHDVAIEPDAPLQASWRGDLLEGVMVVQTQGKLLDPKPWGDALYRPLAESQTPVRSPVALTAVPYYAWANRGPGVMRVWIPRAG
ncbi:glycoside hydrolase family 127 protein [Litorilinea aerophila]|uniref:Glycoside hydrolase family 127 protein n=1 Tax=Litorilinea aerophila TaxID=1204385 RepID=A0A540VKQ4_9CHLR|nr:beta-L-arabinofuranosidase domain-containing protein [Litorilinea aerophila]MCC9075031.1 glycoside hydrolase family 127 protein [Litorilinea aerophila]